MNENYIFMFAVLFGADIIAVNSNIIQNSQKTRTD